MKAIILAGGKGTRLQPVTYEIPKALIPVKKIPILNHTLNFLSKSNIEEVYVIISSDQNNDFENWSKTWGDRIPLQPKFFLEDEPKGTFAALREIKNLVDKEDFIVFNGDSLIDIDLSKVTSFHLNNNSLATTCLVRTETSGNYIVPEIDADGNVKSIIRKNVEPGTDFICSGLYIFNHKIFDYDDLKSNFLQIEDHIFSNLISEKKLSGYKFPDGRFFDCGTLESWTKAIFMW